MQRNLCKGYWCWIFFVLGSWMATPSIETVSSALGVFFSPSAFLICWLNFSFRIPSFTTSMPFGWSTSVEPRNWNKESEEVIMIEIYRICKKFISYSLWTLYTLHTLTKYAICPEVRRSGEWSQFLFLSSLDFFLSLPPDNMLFLLFWVHFKRLESFILPMVA